MPARWRISRSCCLAVALAVAWAPPARAADPKGDKSDAVMDEYERQFDAIKADDVAGHFNLAQWCSDQQAYRLLKKQCQYVLSLDGQHAQAKLLLKLAQRELNESAGDPSGPPPGSTGGQGQGRLPRLVTEKEIQRIRWEELDEKDEPRPLSIAFENGVVDRFLSAMEGEEGYTTREERQAFLRYSPTEKAQTIKELSKLKDLGDRFAVDVVVRSDPRRLADFERRVLPLVIGNCATSGCHGGVSQNPFQLYTDAVLNKEKIYTNYLILHDYRVGGKPLIDRQSPDRSLLLTFGLLELSANLDPSYKHAVEIKSPFRGPSDPRYKAIHEWISSLSPIAPDYGVSVISPPASP